MCVSTYLLCVATALCLVMHRWPRKITVSIRQEVDHKKVLPNQTLSQLEINSTWTILVWWKWLHWVIIIFRNRRHLEKYGLCMGFTWMHANMGGGCREILRRVTMRTGGCTRRAMWWVGAIICNCNHILWCFCWRIIAAFPLIFSHYWFVFSFP